MHANEYNTAVKTHSHNLYKYILKMLKDEDEANDIVQDSFLKLWEHRDAVEFVKSKSWLFTTAYRTMLNKIKRDKKTESLELENFEEPYISNNSFELKQLINNGLERLPELQKSIILLRDLEGYDYKEIGEILNLNESQVKVYLFRARKKLKDILKNSLSYHESN